MPAEDPRHFPDILDCLAQLSSDEVPTPPRLASKMLDLLPAEVWRDPKLRWLDPCSKSGAFLREVVSRLIEGLAEWQPDFKKRREHILRKMVFGAAITEITGYITRRTVYCSRDASGDYSVVRFDDEAGNLPFVAAQHHFKNGSCTLCGVPKNSSEAPPARTTPTHSSTGPTRRRRTRAMEFDVIVGNPPYQISSNGSTRTKPLYHRFVREAVAMNPRYVLMITPSRWFAGGLGLKEFRAEMLKDRRLSHLVDYRVEKDVFPKVNVNGGVSYFLWDSEHDGKCLVSHVPAGRSPSAPQARYLDEFDLLVRQNEGVRILRRVQALGEPTFEQRVSSQKPFDLHTNFKGAPSKRGLKKALRMHSSRAVSWVPRARVTKSSNLIDRWKVFLVAASDGNETFPAPIWDLAKGPFVGAPGEICNGSYLVVYPTDDEAVAEAVVAFLRTRFVRFLVSLRKIAQHNDAGRFSFVPDLPMDREWTDEQLYERYGLSDEEIAFIKSQIKEMPTPELTAK